MKNKYIFYLALVLISLSGVKADAAAPKNKFDSIKLYEEKEQVVQVFSSNNNSVSITQADVYLMAQIVSAESLSEPYEGKIAVASVILNRAVHPEFPKSIEGVINQKGAFSCVKKGRLDVVPTKECINAVSEALKGKDPTDNALFFYNPKIATSGWMKQINKSNVKPIGNHVFFVVINK